MPTPSVLTSPIKHVRTVFENNQVPLRLPCSSHSDAQFAVFFIEALEIAGFNETVRNWHGEWYLTRSSRGIGIQFSTSNNTTSLNDHWLVYRHCAKLRNWDKVEKLVLPHKQTTTLSPISPLFVCNFSAQSWKCWTKTGINKNSLECKRSKLMLDFAPKYRVAEDQTWSSFKGWCHLLGPRTFWCRNWTARLLGVFLMRCESVWLKGLARTQIPTNKNDDVEFPTFGEIAGVNHSLVQWSSLALEEPPSWSWLRTSRPGKYASLPCLQNS